MDESLTMAIRAWLLKPLTEQLDRMETKMANEAAVLNEVAAKLRDGVIPNVSALLAENLRLRTENADLKSEDVAESEASTNVVTATNELTDLFAAPDLPDVPPVEEPTPEA